MKDRPGGGSRAAHLAYVAEAVLIRSTSFVPTKAALVKVEPITLGATPFALAALLASLVAAFFGGSGAAGHRPVSARTRRAAGDHALLLPGERRRVGPKTSSPFSLAFVLALAEIGPRLS